MKSIIFIKLYYLGIISELKFEPSGRTQVSTTFNICAWLDWMNSIFVPAANGVLPAKMSTSIDWKVWQFF